MKIKFLYSNGKTWTSTQVSDFYHAETQGVFQYDVTKNLPVPTTISYEIPTHDLLSVVVMDKGIKTYIPFHKKAVCKLTQTHKQAA